MQLIPAPIKGRNFTVALEGLFDVRRSQGSWTEWHLAPMRASTAALSVIGEDGALITRQHLDLANSDQPGPTWHIQLGGLPSLHERTTAEWLDEPRWPTGPVDFMLFVELAVFSFRWDAWRDLQSTHPWRSFVQKSEALVLDHYRQELDNYWNQRATRSSWLGAQCNQMGSLASRPS